MAHEETNTGLKRDLLPIPLPFMNELEDFNDIDASVSSIQMRYGAHHGREM